MSKIIIILFPVVLGSGYAGVTFYNKMLKTIEATSKFTIIEDDIKQLKLQVAAIKERQLEGLDANIRLQEKAADAYVLSKEASAISKATQRELAATSENLKSEVKTMIQSVEDKLDVIKRATTNPLDRR
jgi:hypothetical protein